MSGPAGEGPPELSPRFGAEAEPAGDPAAEPGLGGDAPLPSLPMRLMQVFTAPGALFDRLRERPAWAAALLLVVGLSVAGNLLMPDEILRQAMEAQMPAAAEAGVADAETVMRFARVSAVAGALLGPPVFMALVALAVLCVYTLLLGGAATFRQTFSVTAHTFLIPTVGGLLQLALVVARGDLDVTLSLHLLAPVEHGTYAYRLLLGLNVFGLWAAAVLGIGVSRLYPRRSAGTAVALLVGGYVVLKAGLATLGGLG